MVWDSIYTTSQLQDLSQILDLLSSTLYKLSQQTWEEIVQTKIPSNLVTDFIKLLPENRKKFLDELNQQIKELKVLRLRIAIELPLADLEQICQWARKNLSADIILDVEVDPSLVAGAEISFQGKYVDMSKKSELEKILEKYGRI